MCDGAHNENADTKEDCAKHNPSCSGYLRLHSTTVARSWMGAPKSHVSEFSARSLRQQRRARASGGAVDISFLHASVVLPCVESARLDDQDTGFTTTVERTCLQRILYTEDTTIGHTPINACNRDASGSLRRPGGYLPLGYGTVSSPSGFEESGPCVRFDESPSSLCGPSSVLPRSRCPCGRSSGFSTLDSLIPAPSISTVSTATCRNP